MYLYTHTHIHTYRCMYVYISLQDVACGSRGLDKGVGKEEDAGCDGVADDLGPPGEPGGGLQELAELTELDFEAFFVCVYMCV